MSCEQAERLSQAVRELSESVPKTKTSACYCFKCKKIYRSKTALAIHLKSKCNSDKPKKDRCTEWDVVENVPVLKSSIGELSLAYKQHEEYVFHPDIYQEKLPKKVGKRKFDDTETAVDPKKRKGVYEERTAGSSSTLRENSRKYTAGSRYDNFLYGQDVDVIDIRKDHKTSLTLAVELESGEVTKIKISDASGDAALLDSVTEIGECLKLEEATVRKPAEVGDSGKMFGIGFCGLTKKEYAITRKGKALRQRIAKMTPLAKKYLFEHYSREIKEIQAAEKAARKKKRPKAELRGLVSALFVSIDLANAAHVDFRDIAPSIGIWTESHPGNAVNWYFLFPRVGIAVKLFHGCVISWDGRVLHHCTSKTKNVGVAKGKHVYSAMFGCTKGED